MNNFLFRTFVALQYLLTRQEGQDLVEYALLIALLAFGCAAGMGTLAASINSAFNSMAGALTMA